MLIVSFGMHKSGSTLAFEIAKRLLEEAGLPQRKLPDGVVVGDQPVNVVREWTPAAVKGLLAEIAPGERIVVKTHRRPKDREARAALGKAIRERQAKVHVNVRDPRDVCLALLDAGHDARARGRTSFAGIRTDEDALKNIDAQIRWAQAWANLPDALILNYEDVAFDGLAAIRRIAEHLGVTCNAESVYEHVWHDAFTQKNKAVPQRHIGEMSAERSEEIRSRFAPFISRVIEQRDYSWFHEKPGPS